MSKKKSNYKVMACFDTETTNDSERKTAFAITYQLSILRNHLTKVSDINNDNVNDLIDITIDRYFDDVCERFNQLMMYGKANGIVPVVMVHNLSFEIWILSSYLNKFEVSGCSKSTVKPLTIIINENGEPRLVFWDTLSFWGKSLETLGDECKYPKLSGCWDYSKFRTPETPLTDMELAYAREDVVVPWAYLGYYMRLNPELDEHELAHKLLTKTSTVRYKSMKRCGNYRINNKTTSFMWTKQNRAETPKSDYELELMHSASRGGFTYCAAEHASKVFHKSGKYNILKYDANSMHICHALAHKVPTNYREYRPYNIMKAFEHTISLSMWDVLDSYSRPFVYSYFARFRFTNVRLKEDTVFGRNRISTFASSRFGKLNVCQGIVDENEGGVAFNKHLESIGWHDWASDDAIFLLGKFYGASECVLILNELSSWEFAQQFDYDSVECIGNGYMTGKATYATDKSVLSFNEFYKNKTIFKKMKGAYENGSDIGDHPDFVPDYLFNGMRSHDPSVKQDVETFYLSVKAELNALYGIEATNEAKNQILIGKEGLYLGDYQGIEGLPNYPKAWYQYGSHIVGWSRIHQMLFMMLIDRAADAFICGDTDSHKIYTCHDQDTIERLLEPLHDACDRAIDECTKRAREIKEWFPMNGLGWYECEGYCDAFAASWNKSYIQLSHGEIDITMAGVPCNNKFRLSNGEIVNHSYNALANKWYNDGKSFDDIANLLVGYNVRIAHDITGLNQRKLPEWGAIDKTYGEPSAIYIHKMHKIIGNTMSDENNMNSINALANNPNVNVSDVLIDWPIDSKEPLVIRYE